MLKTLLQTCLLARILNAEVRSPAACRLGGTWKLVPSPWHSAHRGYDEVRVRDLATNSHTLGPSLLTMQSAETRYQGLIDLAT